eukprot:scaffold126297_cov48-Phaeocystis_antarctica.AAC.1
MAVAVAAARIALASRLRRAARWPRRLAARAPRRPDVQVRVQACKAHRRVQEGRRVALGRLTRASMQWRGAGEAHFHALNASVICDAEYCTLPASMATATREAPDGRTALRPSGPRLHRNANAPRPKTRCMLVGGLLLRCIQRLVGVRGGNWPVWIAGDKANLLGEKDAGHFPTSGAYISLGVSTLE